MGMEHGTVSILEDRSAARPSNKDKFTPRGGDRGGRGQLSIPRCLIEPSTSQFVIVRLRRRARYSHS